MLKNIIKNVFERVAKKRIKLQNKVEILLRKILAEVKFFNLHKNWTGVLGTWR